MARLHEIQAEFCRAILTGEPGRLERSVTGTGLAPEARLRIYRNHYLITLAEALAATFPVTRRLLGQGQFEALARRFACEHPPLGPCLFEYGAQFSGFLAARRERDHLAYLSDLARLEWAMNAVRHAPEREALTSVSLSSLLARQATDVLLDLHPAVRLVASAYPIDRIWRANSDQADGRDGADPGVGGARLYVSRDRDGDVVWCRLTPAEYTFLRALRAGRSLRQAWHAACGKDDRFNLVGTLAGLIEGGAFAGLALL